MKKQLFILSLIAFASCTKVVSDNGDTTGGGSGTAGGAHPKIKAANDSNFNNSVINYDGLLDANKRAIPK